MERELKTVRSQAEKLTKNMDKVGGGVEWGHWGWGMFAGEGHVAKHLPPLSKASCACCEEHSHLSVRRLCLPPPGPLLKPLSALPPPQLSRSAGWRSASVRASWWWPTRWGWRWIGQRVWF